MLASESRVRIPAIASLAAWLLLLAPSPAGAQVHAPSLVEGDLPEEDSKAKAAARSGETVPEPALPPEPLPPPPAAPATAGTPPFQGMAPGVSIGPEELKRLQRPIEPVGIAPGRVEELWQARRKASREQDGAASRAAAGSLRDAMRELGIGSLPWHAIAEVREAERSLRARAVDDAVEHAATAVALAPDLPEPHFALARARIASEPTRPLGALRAAWAGLVAAARDPHVARALLGDVAGAVIAALFGAAAATIGDPLPLAAAHLPARLPAPPGGPLRHARPGHRARARAARPAVRLPPRAVRGAPRGRPRVLGLPLEPGAHRRHRLPAGARRHPHPGRAGRPDHGLAGDAGRRRARDRGGLAHAGVRRRDEGAFHARAVPGARAARHRPLAQAPGRPGRGAPLVRRGAGGRSPLRGGPGEPGQPVLPGGRPGGRQGRLPGRRRPGPRPLHGGRGAVRPRPSSTSGWPAWARARRPGARPSRPTQPTWPATGRTTTSAPTPGWWTRSPPPSAWPSSPPATPCPAPSGMRRSAGSPGRSPGGVAVPAARPHRVALGVRAAHPAARPGGAVRSVRPARLPALRPRRRPPAVDSASTSTSGRTPSTRATGAARRSRCGATPRSGAGPSGPWRSPAAAPGTWWAAVRCSASWSSSRSSSWGSWPGSGTGWSRPPSTPRTRWRCDSPWPSPSSLLLYALAVRDAFRRTRRSGSWR